MLYISLSFNSFDFIQTYSGNEAWFKKFRLILNSRVKIIYFLFFISNAIDLFGSISLLKDI